MLYVNVTKGLITKLYKSLFDQKYYAIYKCNQANLPEEMLGRCIHLWNLNYKDTWSFKPSHSLHIYDLSYYKQLTPLFHQPSIESMK